MNRALYALLALLACTAQSGHAQENIACLALADLDLPATAKLTVEHIPAGPYTTSTFGSSRQTTADVPSFCRVAGVVEPAIRFEVWLPQAGEWNGRFQAVGGGGFAGVVSYPAMIPNLQAGYVTASTDTGHVAGELEWLADEGLLRDYGYRAIHEMTQKSKALIEAYYGRAADYNYFVGCSTGGRQGLMEAQRFPDDYDGIVSGAPVNYFVATHYAQLWASRAAKPVGPTLISWADRELVNRAALAQCDVADGVTDGVIEDPRSCELDLGPLQCSEHGPARCLLEDQIEAFEAIYAGPVNSRTGRHLHPGLMPGSELSWNLTDGSDLVTIPREYFRRSVFGDPSWDWRSFDFDADIERSEQQTGEVLNAIDPDLSSYRNGGGKLLLYHGWNDQGIFPVGSINYYREVASELASSEASAIDEARDFFRLFMVPGMAHCRGGPGPNQFDAVAAIEAWVERGEAPAKIVASKIEAGEVIRTRPLCPYPEIAQYTGSGDTDDHQNFVCAE